MRKAVRKPLCALIAISVAASAAAQDGEPVKPGLYTTVDEHEIYLIIGDEQYDLKTGESAFVDGDELQFVARPPAFLNWPCGTSFADGRGSLQTYSIDDMPQQGRMAEIIRRFFDDTQIPDTSPRWLNGESHGSFPASDIEEMITDSYWYQGGSDDNPLAATRPDVLLVSVFRGTGQAVVDTNFLADLKAKNPDGNIPVTFQFAEENQVPISYFGRNPSLADITLAFSERGIIPAEVPMWYAGDKHLEVDPGQVADAMGAPPLSDISPGRLAQLQAELRNNGLAGKPITLSMTPGSESMIADDPERLRAAESLGMPTVPVMLTFFNEGSVASHCGLPPMVGAVGALGTSNEPSNPDVPPEVELPDPPQTEPPVSGG